MTSLVHVVGPRLTIEGGYMRSSALSRVLALPIAAVLLATACGSATPSAATAAPAKQELTVVQGADADTLDPQGTTTRGTLNIILNIAEALTKVTYSETGEPKVEPLLATSWKQLNDTTWQFKLRDGVQFSNGEPFDADAVKYSFGRLLDPAFNSPEKKYAASVNRVDVLDKSTVNIVTKTPTPLPPLDFSQVYMVPPQYTAKAGKEFATKPIGTGPFTLVEWVKDDHITLQANPKYWGGRPKLDKVTFKPIPESATRSAAIQTGQADIVMPIAVTDVATLKGKAGFHVDDAPSGRIFYVVLDQATDPIMKNLKVRQALNYAVDKDAIVKSIFQGNGSVLQGQGLTPSYNGFDPNVKAYPYDVEKAKQLLTDAGYPNGFDMTIWTARGNTVGDYETAQAVAGQLQKVGVRATVKPLEWAVYIGDFTKKKLTPSLLAAWATYPDADAMFDAFRSGGVYSYSDVPEFNAVVQQERSTLDPTKRLQLLQKGAQIEHDQAMAIWLTQLRNFYAVNDHVQGFRLYPNEAFELFQVSIK